MEELLTLRDFTAERNEDIAHRVISFQSYIDQMDKYLHNGYYITSQTNTGSNMIVKHPYTGIDSDVISFVSNDYLGMSRNKETIQAGVDALQKYGTGACAAPVIGGYVDVHRELECQLASFLEMDDSLVFSSGFGANEGTLKALLGKNDIAIIDPFIHDSAMNGLTETNIKRIKHNDVEHLERVLVNVKDKYQTKLVIVDGVYSQDGDIAPLHEIVPICKKHGALLMVDDAHGIGVWGEYGRGIVEHMGLLGQVDIITGTLSKSFGCVGGFVAASKQMIQYLRFYAHHSMFSAALTPSVAASALKALDIIKNGRSLRDKLWSNVEYMRQEMDRIGANVEPSTSQIFPIKINGSNRTRDIAAILLDKGVYAIGITYPAVREKDARIRASILATHEKSDIFALAEALKELIE